MPNSRRRKFSVRKGIAGKKPPKAQNGLQTSGPELNTEINTNFVNQVVVRCSTSNIKIHPNSSRNTYNSNFIAECESSTSKETLKKCLKVTVDKNVEASSSNIDLFDIIHLSEDLAEPWEEYEENVDTIEEIETPPQMITRLASRDRAPPRREKQQRQHRIKVRSPRRRIEIETLETQNKSNDIKKLASSIGTEPINWEADDCVQNVNNLTNIVESIEEDERQSDRSSDDMCRICHSGDTLSPDLGPLISACACRGTVGRVHVKCLERWLTESGKSRCELCGTRYSTRRVHKFGVLRALVMWILSQNAKQLMVDSLGIMLMSPLAVLAAWLSGRTLAGLMTQDAHATPWPLASTFVLACMTLVCYYCWIVSAATRHALGWWIWYRSQYEVRLQHLDTEE